MNILTLFGSPRKNGNSRLLTEAFLARAEALGATVERVFLNQLTYKGCQHCDACKNKQEECILDDDLAPVLAAAAACDVLVMATPVYYGEVTSQLKGFIDRTYSYLVKDYGPKEIKTKLAPGKKLVMVIAQGHPKENLFADIYPRYSYFFKRHHRFAASWCVRTCGVYYLGDTEAHPEGLELAARTAEQVMGYEQGADE
ncbi:MAG: flavodoxin family protein [Proteobacteria bacterium]|nr:flavodoxin family protein [Pseudomonadota bacterium]